MRSITANWFECKVAFDRVMEDGTQKSVTEKYVLNAMSYTEAEAKIIYAAQQTIGGTVEIKDIKQAQYKEVFFMSAAAKAFHNEVEDLNRAIQKGDREKADEVWNRPLEEQTNTDSHWYKAKLVFITIDEKTEKEKRSAVTYLVEATSLHNALDNIDLVMKGSMIDYVQANVGETPIINVFEFVKKEEPTEEED